jgi:hydrogenase nickel incorporation protein HypA/HybF
MHELSLCQSIVKLVDSSVAAQPVPVRVIHIALDIGEAAAVELDTLRFCFPIAAEGSAAEGATLEITSVPVSLRCLACGSEYRPDPGPAALAAPCPDCGDGRHEVLAGKELSVRHIEVREDGEKTGS